MMKNLLASIGCAIGYIFVLAFHLFISGALAYLAIKFFLWCLTFIK